MGSNHWLLIIFRSVMELGTIAICWPDQWRPTSGSSFSSLTLSTEPMVPNIVKTASPMEVENLVLFLSLTFSTSQWILQICAMPSSTRLTRSKRS